jgi:hypothetical protein
MCDPESEMRRNTARWTAFAAPGVLVVAALLLTAGPAGAKKPSPPPPSPPPPVDGGTIYYNGVDLLYRMDPDGSGVTALPSSIAYDAEPSMQVHGGRWFLQVQELPGQTYPGVNPGTGLPRPRLELFAVHESGSPAVQLTDGRIGTRAILRLLQGRG